MGQRTCSIPECGRPHDSRGLCRQHADKARRSGALASIQARGPAGEPLTDRINRIGWDVTPSGCWEWRGARNGGYGLVWEDSAPRRVTRMLFELASGIPVDEGLVVMHSCDNPPCVNPAHLSLGTPADNIADMISKGRDNFGTPPRNGGGGRTPRLRVEDVRAIRTRVAAGESQAAVGADYGLRGGYINNIVHRRRWATVE